MITMKSNNNLNTNMKRYVVAFILTPDLQRVWLIRKNKPEWQKGCLNGIGGKIEEDGESPVEATVREIKEEAGITLDSSQLTTIGYMQGTNNDGSEFRVDIFTGTTSKKLSTQEEEEISLFDVRAIKEHSHIENIPMLIETCIYRLSGHSHFHHLKMIYDEKLRVV